MSSLGEQIAVLDGLAALDPNDGRIGQERARVDQYSRAVMPGVISRTHVIDPSEGANYSGGSDYWPGGPLLPSSVGLAGFWPGRGKPYFGQRPGMGQFLPGPGKPYFGQRPGLGQGAEWPGLPAPRPPTHLSQFLPGPGKPYFGQRPGFGNIPNVLPLKRHVIDYSGGALYSGGSDWVPGLPLLPSSAGLADAFITGGYGRAGLGAPFIAGGYGRAGLGQTGTAVDEDLAGAAEAVETARMLSPEDGRIGQQRAAIDEYGKPIMRGVLERSNVIDPSEGANYSGGSDYWPGGPLLPSSVGLAGLGAMHRLPKKIQAQVKKCMQLQRRIAMNLRKVQMGRSPRARANAALKVQKDAMRLQQKQANVQNAMRYAVRVPQWAQ